MNLNPDITTAADDKFCNIFLNFRKKIRFDISWESQQKILTKYLALFVIFEKWQNLNCRLLQIIGGAFSMLSGCFNHCISRSEQANCLINKLKKNGGHYIWKIIV